LDNKIVTFDKGLSLGSHYEVSLCYWIPQGVCSTFEAHIGLHPNLLNQKSGVKIQLINNDKIVQEFNFTEENPSAKIKLKNPQGTLGLKISYLPNYPHQANIIVIGNPILHK